MDINKLMIGDWLRIKSTGVIGQVTRLCTYKSIDHNTVNIDGIICSINGVEPIELDPVILKVLECKNDFDNQYIFNGEYVSIILHHITYLDKVGFYDVIIRQNSNITDNESNEIIFGYIKYVHELQHLLDIFDIDCEINLD